MDETLAPEAQIRNLPLQTREASIVPDTFRDDDNTVEVVWTTGAKVRRYDWYNDTPYEEELVVSADAVDMSRFDAGAVQVLDSHSVWGGVRNIMGIATRGWLDAGKGRAKLKLSQRDDLVGYVRDIKAGVIRLISVGYSVQRYEKVRAADRTDGGTIPLYRAVRWTPAEISFVAVPADANAGTRSANPQGASPCEIVTRASARPNPQELQRMDETTQAGGSTATTTTTPPNDAATRAAEQQRAAQEAAAAATAAAATRAADITSLCVRHGVQHLAENLIRGGKPIADVHKDVLDELARRDAAAGGHVNAGGVFTVTDEVQTRMDGMQEALLARVWHKAPLTDNGRQFRGMSLIELGRDYLESRGVSTRGMDRMRLAGEMLRFRSGGMQATSDFANLLANVANKRLRMGYEENNASYQVWARRAPNAPDFKTMTVVQLGAAPDLLQTNEHGEFKYGSMTDGKETYSMLTYGRIVAFTRQAIVNDDLRAFDRLVGAFGASASRLENRTVYSILTANANLADGGALFNSTAVGTAGGHANLAGAGAGSALQVSALVTARAAMRKQKGLQNEELNIVPSYLIVPADLEQTAYQLTSPDYVPATQGNISEFRRGGRTALEPVVEALLSASSATAWYLASQSSAIDTVEYCYLDGAEGPVIDSDSDLDVDGIKYRARLDFAAKAIDFRGLYKSPGA